MSVGVCMMNEMKSVEHLKNIHIHDDWITPQRLLDKAMTDYNIIPYLDVCATEENKKCVRFISEKQDALRHSWQENFFVNPPYSKVSQFMAKAYSESVKNSVNGICLVYAKTDTKWWHDSVEDVAEVHFIEGRIKFIDPETLRLSKNSAPYPSCWVIFRA